MISQILNQSKLFNSISESFIWIQQLNFENLNYLINLIQICLLNSNSISKNDFIFINQKRK